MTRLKMMWSLFALVSIVLGEASAVSAAMYRWKNEQGQIQYATTPPTMTVKGLEVKQGDQWRPYAARQTPAPEPEKSAPAVISYSKQNTVIIIPVTLDDKLEKSFAVDTGASYTVISTAVAAALNLTPNPEVPPITLQTANGRVQAPLVNLKTVTVGNLTTPNVTAAIHDFNDSAGIGGLLGLNFLNRFKMTVDATRNLLTLEPVSTFAEYAVNDCVAARAAVAHGQALKNGSAAEAAYYRQALTLCPDLLEAYYYLGDLYYQQKNYPQAIDMHLRIIRMQPDEPQAHYRLGVLYLLARNFPLAKSELQQVLRLEPHHRQAQEYLDQLKNY